MSVKPVQSIPRRAHVKTHCASGHPFTPENLYVRNNGKWMCKRCCKERAASQRRRDGVIPKFLNTTHYRFWQRVENRGDCWMWIAAKNSNGYGSFTPTASKTMYAHRWAYEQFIGPIPDDLELDHLCRTPACVNPVHLEPVTHQVNMRRGRFGMATHCPSGHPYSGKNLRISRQGKRCCRACQADYSNRRRQAVA